MRVVVIGGGITGLTAAHALIREGADVTLFERDTVPGGSVRTVEEDGYVAELGATTVMSTDDVAWLTGSLGIESERIVPPAVANRRYIVRDGRPLLVPTSPRALFATPLLSAAGKIRLLAEPILPRRRDDADESLASLVRRRFGDEVLRYVIDPVIGGMTAGNADSLSSCFALRDLRRYERESGSVIRGAFAEAARTRDKRKDAGCGLVSFRSGLGALTTRLARACGSQVVTRASVVAVRPRDGGWSVTVRRLGQSATIETDAVVYAGSAEGLDVLGLPFGASELLAPARRIAHPPIATLNLGFRREDVSHPLDGFGVLVPSCETRFSILGVVFASSMFADRAPAGHVLLSCFVGGARAPNLALLDEESLMLAVERDLRDLLGVHGRPTFARRTAWASGIPQSAVGHGEIVAAARSTETMFPGLAIAGNWLDSASVGGCIASGRAAARRVLDSPPVPARVLPPAAAATFQSAL